MAHVRLVALKGSIAASNSIGSYASWSLRLGRCKPVSEGVCQSLKCKYWKASHSFYDLERCPECRVIARNRTSRHVDGLCLSSSGHVGSKGGLLGFHRIAEECRRRDRVTNISRAGARHVCALSAATTDVATPLAAETATADHADGHHKHPVEKPSWKANIDFKTIRDNKDAVKENVIHRKSTADVDKVVELYEEFVRKSTEVDSLRAQRNVVANSMKGKLEAEKRAELVVEGKRLKDVLAGLEGDLDLLADELQREGQKVPNSTHSDVPLGGEELAVLRKEVGSQRKFSFPVKDHVEVGLKLDLFDFDAASEVSGNKFYYLKNEAVLLEMALISWALSQLIARGYQPLSTPDLVRSTVVEKCGFQPRAANTQVYSIEGMDLCLAGTAEIPVGGLHMDKILAEAELPLKMVAFSHCFRTEAGAAGAATRGLYRVHQFSKVEIFVLSTPEDSDRLHEELISIEEELYASLGLHFKTLDMSSEDLGAPAYRKFDVEAWMPGLGRYGEISSASNCTDYQARRLNIRYRPQPQASADGAPAPGKAGGKKGKQHLPPPRFVHTLNATACAVPRMIISILENFQQEDGSVIIPEPLRPFMGGMEVIRPKGKKAQ